MPETSYGEQLLREYVKCLLPNLETIYNYRPDWLFGMEIDIFFPEINAGLEFQGDQHYCYTETWGNSRDQQHRDKRKKQICYEHNVVLITVDACNLTTPSLYGKFKWMRHSCRNNLSPESPLYNFQIKKKGIGIQQKSRKYRKLLTMKYNSPTVHKKGTKIRKSKIDKAEEKNEMLQPIDFWVDGWCKGNGTDFATAGWTVVSEVGIWTGLVDASLPQTNNVAEYLAVIFALEKARELRIQPIIHTDSKLVVGQLTQGWKVKAIHLRPLVVKAKSLIAETGARFFKESRENIVAVVGH